MTEGEKEKQEIENLFENIMKENFPNLAKEIDLQKTNSDWKETRTQINGLGQKIKINNQQEQNEEMRIQKNEERLRNLQDIFKHSNI